jgi:hypothetical protein
MSTPDFDQAVLRQALRQTLSHVLDVTLDDQNVNLLRDHPAPYFAPRNTGGTFDPNFLSSPHAPPFQLGYSYPSSQSIMLSSLGRPFAGKNSDNILLAAVLADRRRVRAALLENQQMLTHQAHQRHALLKQQDADTISFLQSILPVQSTSMRPSPPPPPPPPPSTVPTTRAELWQAHGPTANDPIKFLKVLGSNLRGKNDPYIDFSWLPFSRGQELQPFRGGVHDPFPKKLYRMLEDVEEQGKAHIVSFQPHGRAMAIHDTEAFTNEILPKYFAKQSKLISFFRQLYLYGFVRIHSGPDLDGYYHELFLKGRPELSAFMRRTGASTGGEDRRRRRKDKNVPAIQPNFYAMQPIRPSQDH